MTAKETLKPGDNSALDLYGEPAYKLYNQLATMIPNFDPVLDQMLLAMYCCALLQHQRRQEEIETTTSQQKRELLQALQNDSTKQLQETAAELGLTPKSCLEILQNRNRKAALKRRRRR